MSKIKSPMSPYLEKPQSEFLPAVDDSDIDLEALEFNLSISIEERISKHERARKLMIELIRAGEESRGKRQT